MRNISIETERLLLRPLTVADAEAVFEWAGYATEAAKAMISYAREHFGARKFASSHCEPNRASGRVMEKCGLHFVGYGEFEKLDGSCKMRSMKYEGEI